MENQSLTPTTEENSINKKAFSFFSDILETVIPGFIIVFTVLFCFFNVCTVVGSSMFPTLENGEILIITHLFYTPQENDIVVFHDTKTLNEPVIKRVIATGNKWVKIDYDAQLLYVSADDIFDSSDVIDESDYAFFDTGRYKSSGILEIFVPEGYLFVLGDNRNNSMDSRSSQIGLVDERTVIGKAILRTSPFNKFGLLK